MKLALCLAAVSVLALSGCNPHDPEELDDESSEDVGVAEQALCPVVIMPVVDESGTLNAVGSVSNTGKPTDVFYDPDNYTYEVTYNTSGDVARMYDTNQASLTSANCSSVTVTASFWTRDAATGCWSFAATNVATGVWNGTSCDLTPDSLIVPSTVDKVRMSGKSKMGTTFREITGMGIYFGP